MWTDPTPLSSTSTGCARTARAARPMRDGQPPGADCPGPADGRQPGRHLARRPIGGHLPSRSGPPGRVVRRSGRHLVTDRRAGNLLSSSRGERVRPAVRHVEAERFTQRCPAVSGLPFAAQTCRTGIVSHAGSDDEATETNRHQRVRCSPATRSRAGRLPHPLAEGSSPLRRATIRAKGPGGGSGGHRGRPRCPPRPGTRPRVRRRP